MLNSHHPPVPNTCQYPATHPLNPLVLPPDSLGERLTAGCWFRYLVTTATGSQYELDLTARTIRRKVAAAAPLVDSLDGGFSQLRRDGETLELLMLVSCAVGTSATLWLQVRDDHIPTLRTTSPVVRIDALAEHECE